MTGPRAAAALLVLAAGLAGCSPVDNPPVTVPGATSMAPATSVSPQATVVQPLPSSLNRSLPPQTTPPPPQPRPQTQPQPGDDRPSGPQTLTLPIGQTATLRYFDVTVLEAAFGEDGISVGWKVQVCYVQAHPRANADGSTRVSTNPWSALVRDGETGGPIREIRLDEFPRDNEWSPAFETRTVRVGECESGWIGIRHGNPDLQWPGVLYQPRDFGDRITWNWR